MNPFRSKRDTRAEAAQQEAQLARERAGQTREAARRAAGEARVAARHARELGRIAAGEIAAQARQLREPARQATDRVRQAGSRAWDRRDEAREGTQRLWRAGARVGQDLAQRFPALSGSGKSKRRRARRGRGRWLLAAFGLIAAAIAAALVARPRMRDATSERLRTLPDTARRAPQRARDVADTALGRAREMAGSVAGRASSEGSAEVTNGHGGGMFRGVSGVPRAIRERFRTSVEEGKKQAQETEAEMRERYEATKDEGV